MRDPERIDNYIIDIHEAWKQVSDWRFGQLMINFLTWLGRDPFYMEDDEFFAKFAQFMDAMKGENNE